MVQWPLFRDVWALGPPNTGYPGSFPRGLIPRIKDRWWGDNRCWLFSGAYKDPNAITVDINPAVEPDIIADCTQLPLKTESFDFVMLDPPYSPFEAAKLYGLPHVSLTKAINEASRICEPSGYVVLLHRIIPWCHPRENAHKKRLKPVACVGVYTIAGYTNMRALTVWQKQ